MRRLVRSIGRAVVLGAVVVPLGAGIALAHPLGNFTINHYAGIRVEPSRVLVDAVIDEAEIPAFQARQAFDLDGDGVLSAAETAAARRAACESVSGGLVLTVDGSAVPLRLAQAGLSFPPGNGGLSTMRVVCTFDAALAAPVVAGTTIAFRDDFESTRIGWREMAVTGSGVTVSKSPVPTTGATNRLTAYPSGLAGAPDVRSVSFTVAPGGATLAPFTRAGRAAARRRRGGARGGLLRRGVGPRRATRPSPTSCAARRRRRSSASSRCSPRGSSAPATR